MVGLPDYVRKRAALVETPRRGFCVRCHHPPLTCLCAEIQSFDPKIRFAILIHVREAQKRIATGRLAHLLLENSLLIPGYDYSHDARVNQLLADPAYHAVILYPGPNSLDIGTHATPIFPKGKIPLVFVIDGTWTTARKTLQRSTNLQNIPKISFTPQATSRFHVLRRQPRPHFYSTVEAIHQTIEHLGAEVGFETREHDRLLHVFENMVERQLELSKGPKSHGGAIRP